MLLLYIHDVYKYVPMGIFTARVKKLQISTNICGEKLKNCGYQFKWSF